MDFLEYQINARRTAKDECRVEKLSHFLEGLASEIGEIGDTLYYLAMGCDSVGISLEQCAIDNIEKLRKRYPDKFTEDHAAARADKAPVLSGAEA